jgi:hypothetical protein
VDADRSPLAFLVRLGPTHGDDQSLRDLHEVLHVQGDEFRPAEGSGEAQQDQGAVAVSSERVR